MSAGGLVAPGAIRAGIEPNVTTHYGYGTAPPMPSSWPIVTNSNPRVR